MVGEDHLEDHAPTWFKKSSFLEIREDQGTRSRKFILDYVNICDVFLSIKHLFVGIQDWIFSNNAKIFAIKTQGLH